MNHERDTLGRQLEEIRQKILEANNISYDQEIAVSRSMDRFESFVSDYTQLAHSIGTIQPLDFGSASGSASGALGPGGVDYSVDIDLGVDDVADVQSQGRRLRHEIWPALQQYNEGFRREAVELQNQTIQLDDEHDRLAQKVERQKEEVGNLEMKLGVVTDQADDAKDVSVIVLLSL